LAVLDYARLRREGAFGLLAELFPDPISARNLLEDVGADLTKLVAFTPPITPEQYWRSVCRTIGQGCFEFALEDLFACAAGQFPGHDGLRAFTGIHARRATRVLCLLASPTDEARLRLEVEHRELLHVVARATQPFGLVVHPATRTDDIIPVLLNAQPTIVHFAGHGKAEGALLFESDGGIAAPVLIGALASVFKSLGGLDAVVLNSCYSGRYAEALLDSADTVLGCGAAIEDACAIAFSRAFYTALGAGRSVSDGYALARDQLDIDGCRTDELRLVTRDA